MNETGLEDFFESTRKRLLRLSAKENAIFAASISERLLGHHTLALAEDDDTWKVARVFLDEIWGFLAETGGEVLKSTPKKFLRSIEVNTPDLSEETRLVPILMQNLYICLDTAAQFCCATLALFKDEPRVEPVASEFGIDLLKIVITLKETGYIELGSDPDEEMEERILGHPAIVSELEFQLRDLAELERVKSDGKNQVHDFERQARKDSSFLASPDGAGTD